MANEGQTQDSCSCLFVSGLVKIKEANDIEEKLNEVERLLKNAINMPCKVGPSAVTLQISSYLSSLSAKSMRIRG